jgi:hypothetical protein
MAGSRRQGFHYGFVLVIRPFPRQSHGGTTAAEITVNVRLLNIRHRITQ